MRSTQLCSSRSFDFRNSKWWPPPSWIFSLCEFWPFRRVGSVVFVFCTKFGSNICYNHWDRRTFDDVRRINFRFQILVTWSSVHGLVASSHELWCRYLYPIRSYWYFSKIKDGDRRHYGIAWVSHWTTHVASFVVRTSCKNFVMIG